MEVFQNNKFNRFFHDSYSKVKTEIFFLIPNAAHRTLQVRISKLLALDNAMKIVCCSKLDFITSTP